METLRIISEIGKNSSDGNQGYRRAKA